MAESKNTWELGPRAWGRPVFCAAQSTWWADATAYTSRAIVRLWEKTGTKIKKGNFKSPEEALGPAPARCQHLVWSAGVGSVTCRKGQAREVPGKFGRFFMRSLLCLRWSRPQVGKLLPASLMWLSSCFCKYSFTGTQPHSFICCPRLLSCYRG